MRELALKLRRRWVSGCGWLWRSSHIYIFTGAVSCVTNMERPRVESSRTAMPNLWHRKASWQSRRRVAVGADRRVVGGRHRRKHSTADGAAAERKGGDAQGRPVQSTIVGSVRAPEAEVAWSGSDVPTVDGAVAAVIGAVPAAGGVSPGGGGSGTAALSGIASGNSTGNSISSRTNGCVVVIATGRRITAMAAVVLRIEDASSSPPRQSSRNWLTIDPKTVVKKTFFYSLDYTFDIRSIVYT